MAHNLSSTSHANLKEIVQNWKNKVLTLTRFFCSTSHANLKEIVQNWKKKVLTLTHFFLLLLLMFLALSNYHYMIHQLTKQFSLPMHATLSTLDNTMEQFYSHQYYQGVGYMLNHS
jgi:hypothetical protein